MPIKCVYSSSKNFFPNLSQKVSVTTLIFILFSVLIISALGLTIYSGSRKSRIDLCSLYISNDETNGKYGVDMILVLSLLACIFYMMTVFSLINIVNRTGGRWHNFKDNALFNIVFPLSLFGIAIGFTVGAVLVSKKEVDRDDDPQIQIVDNFNMDVIQWCINNKFSNRNLNTALAVFITITTLILFYYINTIIYNGCTFY